MKIEIDNNIKTIIAWIATAITIIFGLMITKNPNCLWGLGVPVIVELFTLFIKLCI